MANTRRGNVHYVDSTGTLTSKLEDKVAGIIYTATAATAVIELSDTADAVILKIQEPTSGTTHQLDFTRAPLAVGPKGLKCKTLTNAVFTLIYTSSASGGGSD